MRWRSSLWCKARLLSSASLPPHTVLELPALSPTMTHGNVAKYLVAVGDTVQAGDRVAEIETDKATVDFDVVDGGTVAKFLLQEGATEVAVGTPMIVICDEPGDVNAFADYQPAAAPAAAAAAPAATPAPATTPAAAPAAAAPAPAAAAPPLPAAPVSLPAAGGRVYWNESRGWYRA